jgi:hypothetical protein
MYLPSKGVSETELRREMILLLERFHPGVEFLQEISPLPASRQMAMLLTLEHMLKEEAVGERNVASVH